MSDCEKPNELYLSVKLDCDVPSETKYEWIDDKYVKVKKWEPGDLRIDYGDVGPCILTKGETYHALPQPELEYLHCQYCDCNVETAPTCSQCGAPLKNPACDAPIGYLTSWSI